jgi:hypothetical protein
MLAVRGRPPRRAAGNIGAISAQAASVRSVSESLRLQDTDELRLFSARAVALEAHIDQIWIPIMEGCLADGERPPVGGF